MIASTLFAGIARMIGKQSPQIISSRSLFLGIRPPDEVSSKSKGERHGTEHTRDA